MWGRLRHDVTALLCLMVLVVTGIVAPDQAFAGFAHPAVITVAAILVVSAGLQRSGLIDRLGSWLTRLGDHQTLQITVLTALVTLASGFMNNVGALAVLMPVAIHLARQSGYAPSRALMPLAFGSLLGGMTTLIGTPPNIVIAAFRAQHLKAPFSMFDFAPVGVVLSVVGVAFIGAVGWRLLPKRQSSSDGADRFHIEDYISEVRLPEGAPACDMRLAEIEAIEQGDVRVLGLIRSRYHRHAPSPSTRLRAEDILVVECGSEELKALMERTGVTLVGGEALRDEAAGADEIAIAEVVIRPDSALIGRTAAQLQMRERYEVNLLAIARQEKRLRQRIDHLKFRAGDVLLLQGRGASMIDTIRTLGCLPLADRGLSLGRPTNIALAVLIFVSAIGLVISGLLEVQIAFTLAALAMILCRILPAREVYDSVDWPVIVLLGAMLPLGAAMEDTGGAQRIADLLLRLGEQLPSWATLGALLVATMLLSAVLNNTATVVLMAPIALSLARGLEASPDPFLMTIAIGASCAFLTPIGHQSNTLVMGPGGYKFSDYMRMGLPLTVIIAVVAIPMILWIWPLA